MHPIGTVASMRTCLGRYGNHFTLSILLRASVVASALAPSQPAVAIVGGASPADEAVARQVFMITSSDGRFCSGVAIARDLVLTAAQCMLPGANYKLVEFNSARQPVLKDITTIARHPDFDDNAILRHRVTADVALVKLAAPLKVVPALLAPAGASVAAGDRFVVAGYGVAVHGDGKTGGTVRAATLVATGQPGTLQIRLADPATNGERAGLGACSGDAGAPVYRDIGGALAVIGVVSWSTGPALSSGCGGLTGVWPLARSLDWITETASSLTAITPNAPARSSPGIPRPKVSGSPLQKNAPLRGQQAARAVSSGTGFFVSTEGHIVTNAHVVVDCRYVTSSRGGRIDQLSIDEASDLALYIASEKPRVPARIRGGRGARVGESVVAVGFPLKGLLSSDPIVTTGTISALAGLNNDRRKIQITAPVQPGNSGGPLLGENGSVVGVVVGKLDALKVAKTIGDIPQNVNFAVSLGTLQSFLNTNGVAYTLDDSDLTKSPADIAAEASRSAVLMECWK